MDKLEYYFPVKPFLVSKNRIFEYFFKKRSTVLKAISCDENVKNDYKSKIVLQI